MPLPKPATGEDRDAFISRCMGDDESVEDFPDTTQRLAVCFRQWDEGKSMKHKFCAFELKDAEETGSVEGYGSVFGNVDQGGDIVAKGAFTESLKDKMPKMLWGHDSFAPAIGVWQTAKEDDHGLLLQGQINMESAMGQEVHSALKMGAIDGLSIGFMTKESDTDKGGITTLKEVDLWEVSFVNFPMNVEARVDAVKAKIISGTVTKRELENLLRDAGFPAQQAKAIVADGYAGLKGRDGSDDLNDELRKLIGRVRNGP